MKNPQRFIKRIVGVSILIILLAPFVLTRPSFETLSFLETGQIVEHNRWYIIPYCWYSEYFLTCLYIDRAIGFQYKTSSAPTTGTIQSYVFSIVAGAEGYSENFIIYNL